VDWNNDGKKDLITGENSGNIRIYLNTNTDADPQFSGYTLLQESGANFDCGSYSHPHVVDWNNDGKKDVLCGEASGRIYLLINTGTDANPVFSGKEFVKDGGGNLDPGGVSAPTVCDLNRDGKKDLLIGETYGKLHFYENKGTDAAPVFNGKVLIQAGGGTFSTGFYTRPDVVDWDDDGVMDIICGAYDGHIHFLHAVGPLALTRNAVVESTGGTIGFNLDAGAANANRNYLIVGGTSGTEPGFALPGGIATLPIDWDWFTDLELSLLGTTIFDGFLGQLDGQGEASAQLNVPPLPIGTAGVIMHFAYCCNGPFDYVSNAAPIEIVP
jgi:hypothetical protein